MSLLWRMGKSIQEKLFKANFWKIERWWTGLTFETGDFVKHRKSNWRGVVLQAYTTQPTQTEWVTVEWLLPLHTPSATMGNYKPHELEKCNEGITTRY